MINRQPRPAPSLLAAAMLVGLALGGCAPVATGSSAAVAPAAMPVAVATPTPAPRAQVAPAPTAQMPAAQAPAAQAAATEALATVATREDPKLGLVLTDYDGVTLYVYKKDLPGFSACSGECNGAFPPYTLDTGALVAPAGLSGKLGVFARADGKRQVTYNDRPLYYYSDDLAAADAKGQGVGKLWSAANAGPTVLTRADAKFGRLLAGPKGMTLYTFTKDVDGTLNCLDACLKNWPPLLVSEAPEAPAGFTGKLGTVARPEGGLQVTLDGQPLYYWVRDKAPGDTTGHGVGGGSWNVATL